MWLIDRDARDLRAHALTQRSRSQYTCQSSRLVPDVAVRDYGLLEDTRPQCHFEIQKLDNHYPSEMF